MQVQSFKEKVADRSQFHVLVEFTCPAGQKPGKILEFLDAYEKEKPKWKDMSISALTVTQNPSGAVTASPTDVIAHIQLAGGLQGLSYVPHVSAKGMNQAEIETLLQGLISYGVKDCFVITGDEPVSGQPVFELDSLNLLQRIRHDNAESQVYAGPGVEASMLWPGAAVGVAKYEEGTCLQQLIKMEKKIKVGGAGFIITNLIFDARKVEDFFRYLKERNIDVPVFGSVFFLNEAAARRMQNENLPGCYVSPEFYEKVRSESYEDWVLRAAQQVAMWRDLGAAGVDLGNVERLDLAQKILGLAEQIGPEWRQARDNVTFPPPGDDLFYVYTPQGERTPLRDPDIPRRRLFLNWMHNLMFEPGSPGYHMLKKIFKSSSQFKNADSMLYEASAIVEYVGKRSLAKCRACGDCYLPENFFVCLMGECTKGLTNVPCGDSTVNGRCGVDGGRPCAGQLVYDAARHFTGQLDSLYRLVNQPKNPKLKSTPSIRNYFLEEDHHMRAPFISVAELFHASLPKVKDAFDIIKKTPDGFNTPNPGLEYLQDVVEMQAYYKPHYIDINVDDAGAGDTGQAAELMRQSVRIVFDHSGGIPPCIDSSDPQVIYAGLEKYYELAGQSAPMPLINSANKERTDFVWELQKIGPFNIVYMLMSGAMSGEGMEEKTTPEALEKNALEFLHLAREHGFKPPQIFYDTTVIPLAIEFSRYGEPGFNYTSIEGIRRIKSHPEMKDCNTILGVTNLVRDFPPGRKIGVLRAFVHIGQEAGLTAGIVDPKQEFGIKPPSDQEIIDIVRAFVSQDGSSEAFDRMQEAYMKYKSYGAKKPKA